MWASEQYAWPNPRGTADNLAQIAASSPATCQLETRMYAGNTTGTAVIDVTDKVYIANDRGLLVSYDGEPGAQLLAPGPILSNLAIIPSKQLPAMSVAYVSDSASGLVLVLDSVSATGGKGMIPLPAASIASRSINATPQSIVLSSFNALLVSHDATLYLTSSTELLYKLQLDAPVLALALQCKLCPDVYVATRDTLYAISVSSLLVKWTAPVTAPSSLVVLPEGILVISPTAGTQLIDFAVGEPVWTVPTACVSPVAVTSGCTLVCATAQGLTALSLATQLPIWVTSLGGATVFDVVVAGGKESKETVLVVSSGSHPRTVALSVYSVPTGLVVWAVTVPGTAGHLALARDGSPQLVVNTENPYAPTYIYNYGSSSGFPCTPIDE